MRWNFKKLSVAMPQGPRHWRKCVVHLGLALGLGFVGFGFSAASSFSGWVEVQKDTCSSNRASKAVRDKYDLNQCRDMSYSYEQPDSKSLWGWEGRCGQTAAGNSIRALCGISLNIDDDLVKYFRDLSPGVYTSTLKIGLNRFFAKHEACPEGKWKMLHGGRASTFISKVQSNLYGSKKASFVRKNAKGYPVRRKPVISLIYKGMDGNVPNLHYVTIVDLERKGDKCDVIYNQWGKQYRASCERFTEGAAGTGYSLFVFAEKNKS